MNSFDYPLQELGKRVKHNASGKDAEFPTVGSVSSGPRFSLDGGVTVAKKKAAKKVAKKVAKKAPAAKKVAKKKTAKKKVAKSGMCCCK
jgi:hypothetical protein